MSREEISAYVKNKVESEKPEKDKKNQFMGMIMKELKGKADGMVVKETIDSIFSA